MTAVLFLLLCAALLGYGLRHMDDEQPNADLLAEGMDAIRSETPIYDALLVEQFANDLDTWNGDLS